MKAKKVDVKKKIAKAISIRDKIAKLRDELRTAVDELADILQDLDTAESEFDDGIHMIKRAVDTMSGSL